MLKAFRATLVHCPVQSSETVYCDHYADGLLLIENGKVLALDHYTKLAPSLSKDQVIAHFPDQWLIPGLIDTHVHYPQLSAIASFGEQLLPWLEKYIFPLEERFCDERFAEEAATYFIAELLRHGTTTALVFASRQVQSVQALFAKALEQNMRLISGKVMVDRGLTQHDSTEQNIQESRSLIREWQGRGRLSYAITPRFALTSTPELLKKAAELLQEFPETYLHTHLAENHSELAEVKRLFPRARHYLDVYDQPGLVGPRSIFAHSLHLCDEQWAVLEQKQASISFCPSSNLFLGSGLFSMAKAKAAKLRIGLGSDVGAGTSLSILRTINEAYKVCQLQNINLYPEQAFYLATLGGAKALSLDAQIGNFEKGKEADFIVLDPSLQPLLLNRWKTAEDFKDRLFSLLMLGDDRLVSQTYLMGELAYQQGKKLG